MKNLFFLITLAALMHLCLCLSSTTIGCLNPEGVTVDWFAIITTPQTIHKNDPSLGFLYFDSTMRKPSFKQFGGYGNEEDNPIGRTVAQVQQYDLHSMIWNDELNPRYRRGSGSSQVCQSKGYLAVNANKQAGFFMEHSVPNYPSTNADGTIDWSIEDSQRQKGQHHLCITINNQQMTEDLHRFVCFTNPKVYSTNSIFSACQDDETEDKFRHLHYNLQSTKFKAIAKNGYNREYNDERQGHPYQADIFSEGVTPLLQSSIIVQTFGAPDSWEPFCEGQYNVGNSNEIRLSNNIAWMQGSDNSKWLYALENDFVCFGDLNRNSFSQTVRGGAYYCLQNANLNLALQQLTPNPETC